MDAIRARPDLHLPDDESLASAIVSSLLETALRQGVVPLALRAGAGWRAIGADGDGEPYVFEYLVPLPGAIQNSFRGEILLTAFAPFWAAVERGQVVHRSSRRFDDASLIDAAAGLGAFVVLVAESP
ncbi:hypothetical protein [Lysobacter sp. yr284]|uniref:hypothetical protein n=1 Tax=Lysobacter sp. yr284 TaxID=1761791 RepID=UPI0011144F3B|nr:hypothetical protein [Lysobacter sp. yr284]